MQEYFSGNKYISTTGDRFLYEDETRFMFIQCSLKEKINTNIFKSAAKAMTERCPFFRVKRGSNGSLYCLMQVNEEIPVIENDGFVLTSDKRSKDFLLTFAYSEKTVYFCFHHALTDAHGAVRFVKSFITEYLRRSTGEDLFVPEELNPATPTKNEEYENPYSYITHQEHPFNLKSTKGFSVPEEDIENTSRHLRVSIPTDCILKISKNAESTFVSVIVMLLSNAISRAYPAHEKPIKIYCPVDMRSMLGCPETLQHCCYGMNFVFEKRLLNMPLNQQLSCLKGMLMLQTSEEYLIDRLEKQKANHEKICSQANSIDDIKEIYNSVQYSDPMVSYVKDLKLGDIEPYVDDFDISAPVRGTCGVILTSYCIGKKCILNLHSNLISDDIFKEFLDTLQDLSIPYTVKTNMDFNHQELKGIIKI